MAGSQLAGHGPTVVNAVAELFNVFGSRIADVAVAVFEMEANPPDILMTRSMVRVVPGAVRLRPAVAPSTPGTIAVGLDPAGQRTNVLYRTLYRLACLPPDRVPAFENPQADVLRAVFGTLRRSYGNGGWVGSGGTGSECDGVAEGSEPAGEGVGAQAVEVVSGESGPQHDLAPGVALLQLPVGVLDLLHG